MLHGIKLRKIVYILTHHKIKSMTLLLKLFLLHILYACGNKITPFSSVCVNSQNFKILNLNCTVLLTLGEKSWLSLMTKSLTRTEYSQKQSDNTKTPPKTSITQTIADRLNMVSWSNDSHSTAVVKPVYGIPTFPLTAKDVKQVN